ncbi:MAG: M23 family metallopeptidase [Rhodothermales bacterium]|nr:M23 family metallopeptidase [Rhodothermales bacterium]
MEGESASRRIRNGSFGPALLIAGLCLAAVPASVQAQEECFDNAFCLDAVRDDAGQVLVRVRNLLPGAITMRLSMELENLSADRDLPLVFTLPAERRAQPVRLRIEDEYARWGYRFDARWIMGTLDATHDSGATYDLPFDAGASWLVGQGYNGRTTHQGKNALDFNLPEGTPVRAARSGTVVEVEDRYEHGGPDQSLKSRANFVKVEHEDGTIGNYVHLVHRGVRVRPGQRVREGEVLGISGNTGFTTGPHLHFEVYGITTDLERTTIPVHFRTSDGREELREGRSYLNPGRVRERSAERPRGW